MVLTSRDARNWLLVIALGIAVAIVAWVCLAPRDPNILGYQGPRAPNHGHQTGGEDCDPAHIAHLTKTSDATVNREACKDAESEKESTYEALDYSARSANAAEQAVLVANYQAKVALGQTLATVGAFAAAGVAVWYAKQAARAADDTLRLQQTVAEQELRPYIFITEAVFERKAPKVTAGAPKLPKKTTGRILFSYKNTGNTPAKNVRVAARAVFMDGGETLDLTEIGDFWPLGPMGPTDEIDDDCMVEGLDHGADAKAHVRDGKEIHLFGRIEYADQFSENRWLTFHMYVGGEIPWENDLNTARDGNAYQ